MKIKAFTLVELMVGLLLSAILTAGMFAFISNASFSFFSQKNTQSDRSVLKRVLLSIGREVMSTGFGTNDLGRYVINGAEQPFIDIENQAFDRLSFWTMTDDMDALASAQVGHEPHFEQFVYEIIEMEDPVVKDGEGNPVKMKVLARSIYDQDGDTLVAPQPILINVKDFQVTVGDDAGTYSDLPDNDAAKQVLLTKLQSLRIQASTETAVLSGGKGKTTPVTQELTQTIYLRNREHE